MLACEHLAQTVDQGLVAIPGQRPDCAGEDRERIRAVDVLGAVRYLPSNHRRRQCTLGAVVRWLNARIIHKAQEIARSLCQPSSFPDAASGLSGSVKGRSRR